MLCLKAEALGGEMYGSHGAFLPVNLYRGSFTPRAIQSRGRTGLHASDPSSSSSYEDGCSRFEEIMNIHGPKVLDWGGKMCCYRTQLEKEVQMLEKQLQEEINLHVALANAVGDHVFLSWSHLNLPDKAQELLTSIDALEITVGKLEEERFALHFCLQNERRDGHSVESHINYSPMPSLEPPSSTSGYICEELGGQVPPLHLDVLSGSEDLPSLRGSAKKCQINEVLGPCIGGKQKRQMNSSLSPPIAESKDKVKGIWNHPNELSEEMVLCMRNIFLCLSGSPTITYKASFSECLFSSSSPDENLSHSSLTSFSDSSRMLSTKQSFSEKLNHSCEAMDQESFNDPYGVNERINWRDIGKYSLATEASWMSIGKSQLEYAAEALKNFRFLVDKLAKLNPTEMCNDEKLAFWINIYNALIMHAYLAYGVPRNDIKLFSLMQKACYTVGGQSFNAADIEFVLLKMKPPAHRPQIASILTLHKFKMSDKHRKYSIDCLEPLTMFALSCGMYSSPAVRIFTANNVQDELQKSMKDYIQASVGLNDKGKLLVPKMLYCYAKGVVEDSLLVDWIFRYLTPDQAAVVRDSTSQRKQRLLRARSFSIIPFDSRFRYLFLPCNKKQNCLA